MTGGVSSSPLPRPNPEAACGDATRRSNPANAIPAERSHKNRSNSVKNCSPPLRFTFEPPRMLCTDDSRSDRATIYGSVLWVLGYDERSEDDRTAHLGRGCRAPSGGRRGQATLWIGRADGLDPGAVVAALEPSRGARQNMAGPATGCVRRCCNAPHDGSNLPPRRFDERASHRPLGPGPEKPGCAYEAKGGVTAMRRLGGRRMIRNSAVSPDPANRVALVALPALPLGAASGYTSRLNRRARVESSLLSFHAGPAAQRPVAALHSVRQAQASCRASARMRRLGGLMSVT